VSVPPVYCKKNSTQFDQNWRRRYILKSAPIVITQVWTRHPRPRCKHQRAAACPLHSGRPHLLPARYDIGTLHRGTFKNSIFGMFINSECSAFGNNYGSGHVRKLALGTTFGGHSELGGFGPGTQLGLKNQRACKSFLLQYYWPPSCLCMYFETTLETFSYLTPTNRMFVVAFHKPVIRHFMTDTWHTKCWFKLNAV